MSTYLISTLVLGISMVMVPSLLEVLNALTLLNTEEITVTRKLKRILTITTFRISACFLLLLGIFIPLSFLRPEEMSVPLMIFGIMMLFTLLAYWSIDHLALHSIIPRNSRVWNEIRFRTKENKEKKLLDALRIIRITGTFLLPIFLLIMLIASV